MRTAKLIKSLEIEEVQIFSGDEVQYTTLRYPDNLSVVGPEDFMDTDLKVEHSIVPVIRINTPKDVPQHELEAHGEAMGRPPVDELYIAYSPEVQQLLEMPFNVLHQECKSLSASLSTTQTELRVVRGDFTDLKLEIDGAGVWQRLKYLFTGDIGWNPKPL